MENVANLLSERMSPLMEYIMQEIADGFRVSSIEASPYSLCTDDIDYIFIDFSLDLRLYVDLLQIIDLEILLI